MLIRRLDRSARYLRFTASPVKLLFSGGPDLLPLVMHWICGKAEATLNGREIWLRKVRRRKYLLCHWAHIVQWETWLKASYHVECAFPCIIKWFSFCLLFSSSFMPSILLDIGHRRVFGGLGLNTDGPSWENNAKVGLRLILGNLTWTPLH